MATVLVGAIGCAASPSTSPAVTPETTSSPPPPPQPLKPTDAFYIVSMPAPAHAPDATICTTSAECDAAIPPNPPFIVRDFGRENWVVIHVAPENLPPTVASDGATATVTIPRQCPNATGTSQVVLYRVAKSVTKATVVSTPAQGCK